MKKIVSILVLFLTFTAASIAQSKGNSPKEKAESNLSDIRNNMDMSDEKADKLFAILLDKQTNLAKAISQDEKDKISKTVDEKFKAILTATQIKDLQNAQVYNGLLN